MTGTITVAGEGATVDTQADINERADGELNQWLDEGRAAKKKLTEAAPKQVKNPDDSDHLDLRDGRHHRAHRRPGLLPADGRGPSRRQRHVREQLPGAPHGHVRVRRPAPANPLDPALGPPTGPSPLTLTPTGGPFNSGWLPPAAPPNAPPPEAARSFTFVIPEAGDYPYACLLHAPSGMAGSIKVA